MYVKGLKTTLSMHFMVLSFSKYFAIKYELRSLLLSYWDHIDKCKYFILFLACSLVAFIRILLISLMQQHILTFCKLLMIQINVIFSHCSLMNKVISCFTTQERVLPDSLKMNFKTNR